MTWLAVYYDPRQVVIDLIANIFKEQKPPLIRPMIAMANCFLAEMGMEPVTLAEVQSYYRQDKFIWQFYGSTRRLDAASYIVYAARRTPTSCLAVSSDKGAALTSRPA